MKILTVIPSLARGGAETVITRLADEWQREGHSIKFLTFSNQNSQLKPKCEVVDLGLGTLDLGFTKPIMLFRRAISIAKQINAFSPDLAISFTDSANLPLCLSRMLNLIRPTKLVISIRTDPKTISFFSRSLGKHLYPKADCIVFNSNDMKSRFENVFCLNFRSKPQCTGLVIRNPIPDHFFFDSNVIRKPIVMSCGRLSHEKGCDLLIEAFSKSKARLTHRLLMLGDGALRQSLPLIAGKLGIGHLIDFPGDVHDPSAFLKEAEIFVLPSRFEGFPNALAEAMASGCPSIAFDCHTGPRELITNGVNGLLVSPENVSELAISIDRLVQEREFATAIGIAGKRSVSDYTIKKISKQWMALADSTDQWTEKSTLA